MIFYIPYGELVEVAVRLRKTHCSKISLLKLQPVCSMLKLILKML